jgi:Spy/CpxP family protein refolding chaperone
MKKFLNEQKIKFFSIFLLFIVFISGVFAGVLFARVYDFKQSKNPGEHDPGSHLIPLHELNLSPEQMKKAHEIGEKYRGKLESIRLEIQPKVKKIHNKMKNELIKHLTPEQIKKLENLHKRNKKHPPHGGPHGPGMGPGMGPHGMGPGHHGRNKKPPQQAIDVCKKSKRGDKCSFSAPHGKVTGICDSPSNEKLLFCIPSFH